jgi:hypothetical protein
MFIFSLSAYQNRYEEDRVNCKECHKYHDRYGYPNKGKGEYYKPTYGDDNYYSGHKYDNKYTKRDEISIDIYGGEIKFLSQYRDYEATKVQLRDGESKKVTFSHNSKYHSYNESVVMKFNNDSLYFDNEKVADLKDLRRVKRFKVNFKNLNFRARELTLDVSKSYR